MHITYSNLDTEPPRPGRPTAARVDITLTGTEPARIHIPVRTDPGASRNIYPNRPGTYRDERIAVDHLIRRITGSTGRDIDRVNVYPLAVEPTRRGSGIPTLMVTCHDGDIVAELVSSTGRHRQYRDVRMEAVAGSGVDQDTVIRACRTAAAIIGHPDITVVDAADPITGPCMPCTGRAMYAWRSSL